MNSDTRKPIRLLFYVEQNYSFDILRPLQKEAIKRGYEVRWLLLEKAEKKYLRPDEQIVADATESIAYQPDAVFASGDRVPGFFPGLKVQVFHGLNEEKRGGQYPERGLFDLYCTEGPSRTSMLDPLAKQRGYFQVKETGWLKLDTLFNHQREKENSPRPQILLASTFTPSLSGAADLYPMIQTLRDSSDWQWLVTLHPKMDPATVALYRALQNENLQFFDIDEVIGLLHRADIMVSDNSSILQEFLLLAKPVVTYRNREPQPWLINIHETAELSTAIDQALNPSAELIAAIQSYGPSVTPWLDGASASRVMDATEQMLAEGWQNKKPANIWRNLKIRRQLNYYRP